MVTVKLYWIQFIFLHKMLAYSKIWCRLYRLDDSWRIYWRKWITKYPMHCISPSFSVKATRPHNWWAIFHAIFLLFLQCFPTSTPPFRCCIDIKFLPFPSSSSSSISNPNRLLPTGFEFAKVGAVVADSEEESVVSDVDESSGHDGNDSAIW